jgi:hypothetical protein
MADNTINLNLLNRLTRNRLDSLSLEQQSKYRTLGLTYTSNNESIIPRDTAGYIMMQEGSSTNPLLIIDAVSEQITTKSALRVLDTAFQYYKFPVSVNVTSSSDLDSNFEFDQDIIYARYMPSADKPLPTDNSGLDMSMVVEGVPQGVVNKYYITKEIKNSGKDLRFRVNMNHRYDDAGYGTVYFYIYRNGPEKYLDRNYRSFASEAIDGTGWGFIYQYEVQNAIFDGIIPNSEFDIGDTFSIGAEAGQTAHTLTAAQTYWVITDASKDVDEWNQPIS